MINGNISKKGTETIQTKNNSKSKVTPANIISKPNSGVNANKDTKKKEEEGLIFKDKSPMMFNRSKNNFYSKDSAKSNYGKFNSANPNSNNINTINYNNNKVEFVNNPIGKINSNNLVLNKNANVKYQLSNNLKSPNNINAVNNNFNLNINENKGENLFRKNLISQQNVILSNEKINNFMVNQENPINQALKRELDMLKTELSIANLKLKEKDKRIDLLENQLINQKEENKNLKTENAELKKKLEDRSSANNTNFINENETEEFPALYRRRNLHMFNGMLDDFMRQIQGANHLNEHNQDHLIDEICPNPDNMTYEQLLELQEKIGYVSKGLSQEEKKEIPVITFNKRDKRTNMNTACTICLMDFENNEKLNAIRCGHQFHIECLDGWVNNEKVCPICKNEIV